jgi:RNA polymerase-binding transcription factor DksA
MPVSLPVICARCEKTYNHVEVPAERLEASIYGICPECMKPVDAKLFGASKGQEQKELFEEVQG